MTTVHLDTCFLIRALISGSAEDAALRRLLGSHIRVAIGAIAWSEFLCGPLSDPDRLVARRLVGSPLAFTEADATAAAELYNRSGRKRGTFLDCMVAASALRERAQLATSNPEDFRPFADAGLEIFTPPERAL